MTAHKRSEFAEDTFSPASMDTRGAQEPSKTKLKRDQQQHEKSLQGHKLPQKKFFRQRAHANPFSDHALTYPASPDAMDWSGHYPAYLKEDTHAEVAKRRRPEIEVADIGCGYGGLLFALSERLPQTLILGLEIRTAVTDFVSNKIDVLRRSATSDCDSLSKYQNIAVLRTNTMKFMPNFFYKGQLSKIFLCFPDPHFKARKHKARIASSALCSEYAYVLKSGGIVYTITDVEDLHQWMAKYFDGHPSFRRVEEADLLSKGDQCIEVMKLETEEGKKVERNNGKKLTAYWMRLEDSPWPDE